MKRQKKTTPSEKEEAIALYKRAIQELELRLLIKTGDQELCQQLIKLKRKVSSLKGHLNLQRNGPKGIIDYETKWQRQRAQYYKDKLVALKITPEVKRLKQLELFLEKQREAKFYEISSPTLTLPDSFSDKKGSYIKTREFQKVEFQK